MPPTLFASWPGEFRFACRQLIKSPGFTTAAILTLALGIGANTAIFSLVDGVLLKPLPFPRPAELVSVFENNRRQNIDFATVSAPVFQDWGAQNSVFSGMAAFQAKGFDLLGPAGAERIDGLRTTAGLFSLLGVSPVLGRGFTAADAVQGSGQVVIVSHRLWRERFGGNPGILGKTLTLDGQSCTVIGVLPAGFRFANTDSDLWVPIAFEPWEMASPGSLNYRCVARLKPGVSWAQARGEMELITARIAEKYTRAFPNARDWGITLQPLQEDLVGGARKPLYLLLGAVGLVLLIACANVANLLLVRAAGREREFALRAALGAGRRRILAQLLAEGFLLSGGGALLGWLGACWAVAGVSRFGASSFPRLENVRLDGTVLGFTLGVSIVTGLVFGLAPAWAARRIELGEVLKDSAHGSTAGRAKRFSLAFVVLQVALAFMLLIGASLLLRSFSRLRSVDLGFRPEHLLTAAVSMPDSRFPNGEPQRIAFLARLLDRISALPGVDSAATVMGLPLSGLEPRTEVSVEGRPPDRASAPVAAGYSLVSGGYFDTIGVPLLRGRRFDSRDSAQAPLVAIVNQTFARNFFPHEDPLGRRLRVMDSHRERLTEIVGIVPDIRQQDMAAAAGDEMYFPTTQRAWPDAQVVLRTRAAPTALIEPLRKAIHEVDSAQTVYLARTFDSLLDDTLAERRFQAILLGIFAGIAALLSAVGIYGVMAYVVTQRTNEIGVRVALGAQRRDVLVMIARQGMGLALAGVAAGALGAALLARLLGNLLFEIGPLDPTTFALTPLLLMATALVACGLPAWRAAMIDPLVAMRR